MKQCNIAESELTQFSRRHEDSKIIYSIFLKYKVKANEVKILTSRI